MVINRVINYKSNHVYAQGLFSKCYPTGNSVFIHKGANSSINLRHAARVKNPRGQVVLGGDNVSPLVEIGLTDPPKSGGAAAPPASPLVACLLWNDLAPFVGNGTKFKIPSEIKPPLIYLR